jgi:hypothetical protein
VFTQKGDEYAIDLIPVLTETGGGAIMAFLDGIVEETTDQLAGEWCGDLLQIVDKLPDGYSLVNCCFADAQSKVKYCYLMFGSNKDGFLLKNTNGDFCKVVGINIYGESGYVTRLKIKETNDTIEFIPVDLSLKTMRRE